ncbi:hypothetical protein TWF694_000080 [Orbilia ellipsospora]|uniref:Putative transcription factor kapC n=1 Tax=Orbilia ellipsospora TaxID=2528407 RepID=A0AAV9XP50_9PEZI
MTEVVAMANGHRTLPAPTTSSTITSTQVPHNFLKLLLLPVEDAPRVSSATNIPSFLRHHQDHHQQSSSSSSYHHNNHQQHHNNHLNHHQPQQQHTPSSSAEQPTKRTTMNLESEPPASSQPVRDWSIDPHLSNSKDTNHELLLRKQLLSAISGDEPMQQPTPVSSQQQPPNSSPTVMPRNDIRPSSSLSPASGGEDSLKADSRQKRELNTSKRAAQNRNAQRAFRARKEEYIKSLESKVRDYEAVEERNQALESENAALRQYIMHLQRRLLDHLGEGEALPDPPAGLNIENLHISSRPPSAKMSLKPELPPISAIHDKTLEPVAGVKRARVDE